MAAGADEEGYTLAEMLAALLIVSLTIGGLAQAGYAIGRLQLAAASDARQVEAGRDLQARFQSLLASRGPFRSNASRTGEDNSEEDDSAGGVLEGSGQAFTLGCGEASCGAALQQQAGLTILTLRTPQRADIRLGRLNATHFLYIGSASTQDSWPPAGGEPQRLKAILLLSQDGEGFHPIASARVWRQEEPGCRFDVVTKDCRAS